MKTKPIGRGKELRQRIEEILEDCTNYDDPDDVPTEYLDKKEAVDKLESLVKDYAKSLIPEREKETIPFKKVMEYYNSGWRKGWNEAIEKFEKDLEK